MDKKHNFPLGFYLQYHVNMLTVAYQIKSQKHVEQSEKHIHPIFIRNLWLKLNTHAQQVSTLPKMGNGKDKKGPRNRIRWFQEMRKVNPIPLVYIYYSANEIVQNCSNVVSR